MRRKSGRQTRLVSAPLAARDKRVQIGCPEPWVAGEDACTRCGLPLVYHQIRFEILEYDDDYDTYVLHAVTHGKFDPLQGVSRSQKLLRVSGGAFESFKECR